MRRRKAKAVHSKVRQINRELVPVVSKIDVDDPRVQRGCVGKRVYLSKHRARVAISRVRKGLAKEMRMYHCRVCGRFHLATAVEAPPAPVPTIPVPTIQVAAFDPTLQSLTGTTLRPMVKRSIV